MCLEVLVLRCNRPRDCVCVCAAYFLDADPSVGSTPEPGRVHALFLCRVNIGKTLGVKLAPAPPPERNVHGDIVKTRNSVACRIDETVTRGFEELDAEYKTLCIFKETEEEKAAALAEAMRIKAPPKPTMVRRGQKAEAAPAPPPPPEPITKSGARTLWPTVDVRG